MLRRKTNFVGSNPQRIENNKNVTWLLGGYCKLIKISTLKVDVIHQCHFLLFCFSSADCKIQIHRLQLRLG